MHFYNYFNCSYDEKEGPELHYIDYLANAKSVKYAGQGYGGMFAASIFDRYWTPTLTQDQAYDILKKCILEIQKRLVINLKQFHVACVDKNGVKDWDPITCTNLMGYNAAA